MQQPPRALTAPHTTTTPVETAIDLLGDADRDTRLRMVHELGRGHHREAAQALVDRFGHERDFSIRETLTWAALRMPDTAMPLVRAGLRSPRWLARLQAAHTLSKLGDAGDAERLVPLVADPVDCVAARAYWAVAQCGNPVAVPALLAELARGDAEHRTSLTVALAHFGAAAVPGLEAALRHGRPAVRRHAADTLAYLGSPLAEPAVPALADAVRSHDPTVRVAALNALGQLATPDAWHTIDEVAASAPERRLQVLADRLADRLAERRPSERAPRIAARRAATAGQTVPPTPGDRPVQRTWPAPDRALVALGDGPWVDVLGPTLARQVEICRPQYLRRADVPPEVLAQVRTDAYARAKAGDRADALAARIAAGRVEQFIHERVLLEQVCVTDPGGTVDDLLRGKDVRIVDVVRLPPVPFEA
jgi:HEAT repeat protein